MIPILLKDQWTYTHVHVMCRMIITQRTQLISICHKIGTPEIYPFNVRVPDYLNYDFKTTLVALKLAAFYY